MVIWKSDEDFEEVGLELLVGAVDLVDQQDRRLLLADRLEQRPAQQIGFGEDVRLDLVGARRLVLARLDGEQLALVVPLVDRGIGVEAFVALQADQAGAEDGGQGLGGLGLADAGLAFDAAAGASSVDAASMQRHGERIARRRSRRRRAGPDMPRPGMQPP